MLIACVGMPMGLGIEKVHSLESMAMWELGRIHYWIGDEQERWVENCKVIMDRANSKSKPRQSFIKIDVIIQI